MLFCGIHNLSSVNLFNRTNPVPDGSSFFKLQAFREAVHFSAKFVQHFFMFAREKIYLPFYHPHILLVVNRPYARGQAFPQLMVYTGLLEFGRAKGDFAGAIADGKNPFKVTQGNT